MLLIEDLDSRDDVNGIDASGAGICEYGDENMLLDVERTRVQCELPPAAFEEDTVGDGRRHEVAKRHDGDLGGDGGDG